MISNRIVQKNRVATPTGNPYYLWGWGYKKLINNTTTYTTNPILSWSDNWKQISNSDDFACGIKNNGTLWCWGVNTDGQLGLGDTTDRTCPVQVGSNTDWVKVSCGTNHVAAIRNVNRLATWGANDFGQLGDGTGNKKSSPVILGSYWSDVSAGKTFTLGIKTNQTLFGWGENGRGQLGIGSINGPQYTPVQEYTGSRWKKCVAGYSTSFGIKDNDRLFGWGSNAAGQLGQNFVSAYNYTPTEVYNGGYWSDVTTAGFSSAGIKTNGTLWSWGNNMYGQLGLNNTYAYYRPTQVGSDTNWKSIRMIGGCQIVPFPYYLYSNVATFALKNGTGGLYKMYSWGVSVSGLGGQGSTSNTSTPGQIGSVQKWKALSVGGPSPNGGFGTLTNRGMFALKSTNT